MDLDQRKEAGEWVLKSREFDFKLSSKRWITDHEGRELHSHMGEWFSLAVAALASNRRGAPDLTKQLSLAIRNEITREASIVKNVYESGEGILLLKACTIISHNLGDLKRVADAWGLQGSDWGWDEPTDNSKSPPWKK